MIEAGISKPAPFDMVVVHSFSRFFRDHFELEFYVRKLARNGIKLVSITQERHPGKSNGATRGSRRCLLASVQNDTQRSFTTLCGLRWSLVRGWMSCALSR
jgi:hypothetical protein